MNRTIKLGIGGIACAMFLSGCGSYYQPIAKDTVMVKKLNQVSPDPKREYSGAISEDTAKTLSVEAVNRLFDTHLPVEELSLELKASSLQQVKNTLQTMMRETNADPAVLYKAELDAIPNGIYRVVISNRGNRYVQYIVVLNARDGEVLEIGEYIGNEPASGKRTKPGKEEALSIAWQYLKRLEDVHPDEWELGEQTVLGDERYGILFLRHKLNKSKQYVVTLDLTSKKVMGVSKGIMTVLSYFYLAPVG